MASTRKDPVLVVLQLTGGNDGLNTIVPYGDPYYYDYRPAVGIKEDQVLPINDHIGFAPYMGPLKELYDQGKVAIIQGIGYPQPVRSHFRSMDIWHTAEPEKQGTEGWLGRTIKDLDPRGENVLTGVNFGLGLPRVLAMPGVPVASVGDLETYGVLSSIEGEEQRTRALERFARMYAPTLGRGPVVDYLSRTGIEALTGAAMLSVAPGKYTSTVEYGDSANARYMRDIVRVHTAELGSRVLFTTDPYTNFDTHAGEAVTHPKLWTEISETVRDFFEDLKEHQASDNVVLVMYSEFGRRARDNGSGTDHGSASVALVVGDAVKGGLYGEYPSLAPEKLLDGDPHYTSDFRSLYATLLEDWLGLDSQPIVGGSFEKLDFI